jgi:hypothetical protein
MVENNHILICVVTQFLQYYVFVIFIRIGIYYYYYYYYFHVHLLQDNFYV